VTQVLGEVSPWQTEFWLYALLHLLLMELMELTELIELTDSMELTCLLLVELTCPLLVELADSIESIGPLLMELTE
jgi:hypothetical protein